MRRTCTLKIAIRPAPRPKVARRGGTYYPKPYREQQAQLRAAFQQCGFQDLAGQLVEACMTVRKPVPPTSRRYGDIDNLAKAVLDALPLDDSHIVRLSIRLEQGEPCLRVVLSPAHTPRERGE
ncbi:MAG: hypothetical protein KatS3mg019_0925 [Fimbriimonadales bacterium]|nr:MAG: hypothetical protein KatS3mg019_0925 [Fimbriimonadales bacterium]